MKYKYSIVTFKLLDVQETESWLNRKGESGFKIIDTYYHKIDSDEYVRFTLAKEI